MRDEAEFTHARNCGGLGGRIAGPVAEVLYRNNGDWRGCIEQVEICNDCNRLLVVSASLFAAPRRVTASSRSARAATEG